MFLAAGAYLVSAGSYLFDSVWFAAIRSFGVGLWWLLPAHVEAAALSEGMLPHSELASAPRFRKAQPVRWVWFLGFDKLSPNGQEAHRENYKNDSC